MTTTGTPTSETRLSRRVARWRAVLARVMAGVVLGAGLVAVTAAPSSANQPTPPFDEVQSLASEPVPADCPRSTDPRWIGTNDTDVYRLCTDALRLATTTQAQRAILYAFSKLGTPYSQDINKRRTTHFDCSSFVGRAYTAAGAAVRKANGVWVDFFPYFGWTGAYVPVAYWDAWSRYGYEGTNVYRVWNRKDLKAGDIIIQFNGSNPGNSAGNAGHAQIFLGGNKVIQSGGNIGSVNVAYEGNYLSNEWYFRYDGNYRSPASWALGAGTVTQIKAGDPGDTVLGNLTVTGPQTNGYTSLYPCLEGRPVASVNNFRTGETIPNFAATRADADGNICIWQSTAGHVLWDQVWAGDSITAERAVRLLDTRDAGFGIVPGGTVQVIDVGVPSATIMANLTVTGPEANGYTTVYPCTDERPISSNSNYQAWTTVPNFVVTRSDENGQVCVYTHATTHLVWDQSVITDAVVAELPVRRYDSREEPSEVMGGNSGERVAANVNVVVAEGLEPGITAMGNLAVTNPVANGFTTMFPCEVGPGGTSVNNFVTWQTTSNFTAVQADSEGKVCMRSTTETHVIWDEMVQTNQIDSGQTKRLYDSRSPGIM